MARKVKVHGGAASRIPGPPSAKAKPPTTALDETPIFCFYHADRGTSEPWRFKPSDQESLKLLEFLCEMASSTWRDIDKMQFKGSQKHHYQPLDSITRKARRDADRRELGEKFGDEMFRFRLGKRRRLWGFRQDRTFHVVWWDPEHKVYPGEGHK